MTTEALLVVLSLVVVVVAAVGAFVAWRTLARVGSSLRALDERLARQAEALPVILADSRGRLVAARADGERALWALAGADARLEAARAGLAAKRDASDTLRARMISSHATLARIRETTRLLIRAIELRREFLG